jgi:ABC-2 type transport system permease protein
VAAGLPSIRLGHESAGFGSAALNGAYTVWRRDATCFVRDRSRVLGSLGQPVLFLVLLGSGLSEAFRRFGADNGIQGLTYLQFIFPGIVVMAVLTMAIMSAMSVVWDREFGFLKEVLVAPVPRSAVAVGKALGGSTTAMFQGLIMLAFAPFAGVSLTPLTVLELLPVMFLIAFAVSSAGLVLAAFVKTMEGFQVLVYFLLMPMFFLSGALFPLAGLNGWLGLLTRLNPVTYGVDAVRRIVLLNGAFPAHAADELGVTIFTTPVTLAADLLLLALCGAVMIAGAMRAFQSRD